MTRVNAAPGSRAAVSRAITGLAVRQVGRGAAIVAAVAAGMSALVVVAYHGLTGDGVDATAFEELASSPAIRILAGTPIALDNPGGFAVWRTGTPLAVLVAAWALVTATRVTRGEEAAGRWTLLLVGRVTLATVVARHVLVIAAGSAVTGAAVCAALTAVGTEPGGALLYGCGLALIGVLFAGVGAACAQVFASRTAATGVGAGVLCAALLLRMLGDGIPALGGLRWASPFGLLALSRPFAAGRWGPTLLLALAAVAALGAATALSRRRDAGAGLLADRQVRTSRPWLLGSVGAFAVRSALGVTVGWTLAVAAYFLLIGALAGEVTDFLGANPHFADQATRAGFVGLDRVDGYVGALSTVLAVPVGLYTVVRLARLATEETSGRLTLLLANPVTRTRVVVAHAAAALGGATVLMCVAALCACVGAAATGVDLRPGAALAAAANALPVVALSVGAAVLALGAAPRVVGPVGAVPAAGGFLLKAVGTAMSAPGWLVGLSPFSHLAPVPLAEPDLPAAGVMLAIAVAIAVAGAHAYRRRDVLV